jgi:hypothetical protein
MYHHQVPILQQFTPILPCRQRSIRIHTQYPAQLGVGVLLPERAQRIDSVGFAGATQLGIVCLQLLVFRTGKLQHLPPMIIWGLRLIAMTWSSRQNHMHAIKVETLLDTLRRVYMPEMHRVKGSAIKADSHEPSPKGPQLAKPLAMTNLTVTKDHVFLRG